MCVGGGGWGGFKGEQKYGSVAAVYPRFVSACLCVCVCVEGGGGETSQSIGKTLTATYPGILGWGGGEGRLWKKQYYRSKTGANLPRVSNYMCLSIGEGSREKKEYGSNAGSNLPGISKYMHVCVVGGKSWGGRGQRKV